jgi:membrane protease YdiL (CAAX protease family)
VNLVHLLFLGTLLVGLPAMALLQAALMARMDPQATLVEGHRKALYRDTVVVLLLLGGAAVLLGVVRFGWEGMWLQWPAGGLLPLLGWTLAGVAGGVAMVGAAHVVGVLAAIPERPMVAALLPRTPGERVAFAGVSSAAGLGEEVAFRGYALAALGGTLGLPLAVLVSSVSFGFAHAYQGPLGVARTAATGGVLAGITLLSASLWPAVLAHVLVNLIMGIAGGERLLRRPLQHGT